MQIILLEKIGGLGNLGDVVTVKNGYARNFLIPQGKAKRATEAALPNLKLVRPQSWPMRRLARPNWKANPSPSHKKLAWMAVCSVL